MNPSRRQFLARGLALGSAAALPGLIAACGGAPAPAGAPKACGEGMAAADLDGGLPPVPDRLPTLAEMDAHSDALLRQVPGVVESRLLGESAAGRPIRLLSVGEGPRSALVVGAPHPNEPVGCATIERFLEILLRAPDLRQRLGYRWHFIKAIDPDGVALNEGWFGGPRTPRRYLESFYRPAFRFQPEYTFPLELEGYRFRASTPENRCWQKALELSRPHLQCSLHNADLGGAFFLVSRDLPDLSAALSRLPAGGGLPLNEAGEPFAEMPPLRPGVFAFPDPRALVQEAIDGELPVGDFWDAGLSSAQFAGERYGTFSMTCEVPLWTSTAAGSARDGDCSGRDIIEAFQRSNAITRDALAEWLPRLVARVRDGAERMLYEALADTARNLARLDPRLGRLLKLKRLQGLLPLALQRLMVGPGNLEPMPCGIHHSTRETMQFASLRAWAMLDRVCGLLERRAVEPGPRSTRERLASTLDAGLARLGREIPMRPMPIGQLVLLQQRAILEAARCV